MNRMIPMLVFLALWTACSWTPSTELALSTSPATASNEELAQSYYALNARIRQVEKGGNGGVSLPELESRRDAIRWEMARRNRDLEFPVTPRRSLSP